MSKHIGHHWRLCQEYTGYSSSVLLKEVVRVRERSRRVPHPTLSARNRVLAAKSLAQETISIDTNDDGDTGASEIIPYKLVVRNVGTVTLNFIERDDFARDGVVCNSALPLTLAPGEDFSCAPNYTVRDVGVRQAYPIVFRWRKKRTGEGFPR